MNMSVCFDSDSGRYVYCTSHLSTYIAVGVIIPLGILVVIALVYVYFRCRQRRIRRQDEPTYMATVIPIYNNDENHQVPYNYSYPPHYTALSEDIFDKPPPYEQTVHQISETHPNNPVQDAPAILPVNTSSEGPVDSRKNHS